VSAPPKADPARDARAAKEYRTRQLRAEDEKLGVLTPAPKARKRKAAGKPAAKAAPK
jgi:hypothetical protein